MHKKQLILYYHISKNIFVLTFMYVCMDVYLIIKILTLNRLITTIQFERLIIAS
jgi:hypothetical protein